jgi:predicted AAA+ superfamily ATPase
MSLFGDYALIGGMPEAVKIYAAGGGIAGVNAVYSNLFTSFRDDVYKYASLGKSKYVGFVLEQAPLFAGLAVTYEKFGGSVYKSREMHLAFDLLEKAMLIKQVRATKSQELPLAPKQKKPAKLIFLDAGLVNFQMGIQNELIKAGDLTDFYQGRIAEQIVGQQLAASFMSQAPELFYWYKGEKSEAEVDFCVVDRGKLVGIEVKSGRGGRMRSAGEFMRTVGGGRIIRVYGGEFIRDKEMISLPFYLLPRWREAWG